MSLPLLIGTYTETNSEGIYHATFDPVSGKLLLGSLANSTTVCVVLAFN